LALVAGFKATGLSVESKHADEHCDSYEDDRGYDMDGARLQTLPPRSRFDIVMSVLVLAGTIRNFQLRSSGTTKSKKTANVFPARFAGIQMNIEYFLYLFVERVIRQADEIIKIEVVISEPERWFESKVERCRTALMF
jgi:hypothetical protein